MAVLRSPTFTAYPGDEITFKFWIRSKHFQTNNLEVYWLNRTSEERVLSLSQYSSPSNFIWRTVSAQIPITVVSNMEIILYGFRGYNEEDSIAIDDIVVGPSSNTTTAVATTSAPSTKPPCPRFLDGLPIAPYYEISTGCYCFYKEHHNFSDASAICRSYGMSLVSLETQEEDAAVVNLILGYEVLVFYLTSGQLH